MNTRAEPLFPVALHHRTARSCRAAAAAAALLSIAAVAPACATTGDARPVAVVKLGEHPAIVARRVIAAQGYDYTSKFYPHPAWLYLLAEAPRAIEPSAIDVLRHAELSRGWAALRALDCARCHGRDYGGWAAPSLIAAVRDGTRERFDHYVLEGDVARGMPGYRDQADVVAQVDAMYAYLRARAEGVIGEDQAMGKSTD